MAYFITNRYENNTSINHSLTFDSGVTAQHKHKCKWLKTFLMYRSEAKTTYLKTIDKKHQYESITENTIWFKANCNY